MGNEAANNPGASPAPATGAVPAPSPTTATAGAAPVTAAPPPPVAPAAPSSASATAPQNAASPATDAAARRQQLVEAYRKVTGEQPAQPATDPAPGQSPARGPDGKFLPQTQQQGQQDSGQQNQLPTLDQMLGADEVTALRRAVGPEEFNQIQQMAAQGIPVTAIRRFAGMAAAALANIDRKWGKGPGDPGQNQPAPASPGSPDPAGGAPTGPGTTAPQQQQQPQPDTTAAAANPLSSFVPFEVDAQTLSSFEDVGGAQLAEAMKGTLAALNNHFRNQFAALEQIQQQRLTEVQQASEQALSFVHEANYSKGHSFFESAMTELGKTPGYESLAQADLAGLEEEMLTIAAGMQQRDPSLYGQELINRATRAAVASLHNINPLQAAQVQLARQAAQVRAGSPIVPQQQRSAGQGLTRQAWMLQSARLIQSGATPEQVRQQLGECPS